MGMNASDKLWTGRGPLQRFIKDQRVLFVLVGGASTAFSTTLFVLLVLFFPKVPSSVNVFIAWAAALMATFMVYRRLVFRVIGHFWLDLVRFASVNTITLLINVGAMALLADVLAWPPIPVQIGITGVVVLFNYLGHKHFSFRRKPANPGKEPK